MVIDISFVNWLVLCNFYFEAVKNFKIYFLQMFFAYFLSFNIFYVEIL